MAEGPRLYNELSKYWHLVSPPEDYVDEAKSFRAHLNRLGVADGSKLLHLGCGGGSIDFHLKKHFNVTGVDISHEMLGLASGLNPEIRYLQGDMRYFRIDEQFDAVLVHDAIAYMTSAYELEAVYTTAASHLRTNGVLIALPEETRDRLQPNRVTSGTHSDGKTTLTLVQVDHDPNTADNSYESVFLYLIRTGDEVHLEIDRHILGVFELDEFVAAIEKAGMRTDVVNWEIAWPDEETPMPLIVAQKIGY